MSNDTEKFIQSLDFLAKNKNDFNFSTINSLSAAITISKILQYAHKEVKIYDHVLNGNIANQHPIFFDTLNKFFKNKKHLIIVLESEEDVHTELYYKLANCSEKYHGTLEIRLIDKNFNVNMEAITQKDVNFVVSDTNSYRVENIEHLQNIDNEAICNFNDKSLAEKLVKKFDKYYNSSMDITPSYV